MKSKSKQKVTFADLPTKRMASSVERKAKQIIAKLEAMPPVQLTRGTQTEIITIQQPPMPAPPYPEYPATQHEINCYLYWYQVAHAFTKIYSVLLPQVRERVTAIDTWMALWNAEGCGVIIA